MGKWIAFKKLIVTVAMLIALSVPPGWYRVEPYHFVYGVDKSVIAEVWADVDKDRGAGWFWIVYLPTSFGSPYSGVECCMEDAFSEVKKIMYGGYWI